MARSTAPSSPPASAADTRVMVSRISVPPAPCTHHQTHHIIATKQNTLQATEHQLHAGHQTQAERHASGATWRRIPLPHLPSDVGLAMLHTHWRTATSASNARPCMWPCDQAKRGRRHPTCATHCGRTSRMAAPYYNPSQTQTHPSQPQSDAPVLTQTQPPRGQTGRPPSRSSQRPVSRGQSWCPAAPVRGEIKPI